MVLEPMECPVCGGTKVIKYGKSGEGKQSYLCQDQECRGKTFIGEYSDLGRLPQIKGQIIEMSLNGSGVCDITRVLNLVIMLLHKHAKFISIYKQSNHNVMHRGFFGKAKGFGSQSFNAST